MKILICYGTRPEFIKVLPLIKLAESPNVETLCTGQHTDLLETEVTPDYSLKLPETDNNRLNSVISFLTGSEKLNKILDSCSHVLVQGDTASAYACALAAFNKQIKVIHLEAGLRTYNKRHPFPEEAYRQCISRITDIHLCATDKNKNNLLSEGIRDRIYVVGNTVLDNLKEVEVSYNKEVLITLHRRENHNLLKEWLSEIEKLAENNKDLEFIIVSHPNPNVKLALKNLQPNVKSIKPVGHKDFINRMAKCRFLITDSGGLQEEASFLKKKAIVCRRTTERPEALYTFTHLCKSPSNLTELFNSLKSNFIPKGECPFGDGTTAQKINKLLLLDDL